MKNIFLLIILISNFGFAAKNSRKSTSAVTDARATCLKTDNLAWWEGTYCQVFTKTEGQEAPAFKKCVTEYRTDKTVPADKCKKIIWLKQKTCGRWQLKQNDRAQCLKGKDFAKAVDLNSDYYFGNPL